MPQSFSVVRKLLKTHQWAAPLHWVTFSLINMNTHSVVHFESVLCAPSCCWRYSETLDKAANVCHSATESSPGEHSASHVNANSRFYTVVFIVHFDRWDNSGRFVVKAKSKSTYLAICQIKLSHKREPGNVNEGQKAVTSLRRCRCAACCLQLFIRQLLLVHPSHRWNETTSRRLKLLCCLQIPEMAAVMLWK